MESVKNQLVAFFTQPVLLSCVFSWLSAQLIKTFIALFSGKIRSIGEMFELLFWRTGGMPSSHSALVATLCTTIGFRDGIGSDIFILALAFFLVTVRDALGVRRASGIQARTLNKLGTDLKAKDIVDFKPVKEVHGHKPVEVLMGCLLGFFIGLAFSLL